MPDNQSSTTDSKRRARGDMYLRAERRRLAELAAELELTGIETPTVEPVYQMEPESQATIALGTPVDVNGSASATVAVVEPAPTRQEASSRAPSTATTRSDADEMAATAAPPPAIRVPAPARIPRRAAPRSLAPAAVFGSIVAVAALAIAILIWPAGNEAPAADPSPSETAASSPAAVAAAPAVTQGRPQSPATPPPVAAAPNASPVTTPPPRPARPSIVRTARANPAPPARAASEGTIRVTSTPAGARVTVNGIGWGQTPLTIDHLPLGAKTVRVTRDGYRSQQRLVDLRGDRPSTSLHVNLQQGG